MITVACISCSHQYPLDERRLPATGLKMRCPKCGTTFLVFPDGRTEAAAPVAQKNTLLGTPPANAPPRVPPPPPNRPVVPAPPAAAAAPDPLDDLDLPAPRGGAPKPASPGAPASAKAPLAPPFGGDDLDLPAPRGAAPKPAAPALDDLDLPAPRGAAPKPPASAKIGPASPGTPASANIGPASPGTPASANIGPASPGTPASANIGPASPGTPASANIGPASPGTPASANIGPASPGTPASRKAPLAPPFGGDDLDLPAPRGAAPKPPAPAKPAIAPPLDIDLPAPRAAGAKPAIAPPLDIDLPAPRAAGAKPAIAPPLDIDLPAPRGAAKPAAPAAPFDDLDLPAPRGAAPKRPVMDEIDLPAPRAAGGAPAFDVDLPAPRGAHRIDSVKPALADLSRTPFDDEPDGLDLPAPSGKSSGLELDLPAPKGGFADLPAPKAPGALAAADRAFGDLDLPMPKRGGAVELADLPAPRDAADLPAPRGAADLPAPRGGGIDLPAPRGAADLPAVRAHADLPTPRKPPAELPPLSPDGGGGAPFPDLDLPPPRRPAAAAAPTSDTGMGDLDLPPPRPRGGAAAIDQDLELPPPRKTGGVRGSISEFELPVPDRKSLPPRGHGEIDLPGGGAEDMEFSDIPQERGGTRPPSRVVDIEKPRDTQPKTMAKPADAKPRSRTGLYVAIGLIVVVGAVGGALTFTPYGPFGRNLVLEQIDGGDPAAVDAAIRQADQSLLHDTPTSFADAQRTLGAARHSAGHNKRLLSRSLFAEAMSHARFATTLDHASQIRARMEGIDLQDPVFALGIAANEFANGNTPTAQSYLSHARTVAGSDPMVDLLDGEIALAEQRWADASQSFQVANDHQGGAAAQWGLARALSHGEDRAAYDAAIAATLAAAPDHVEALFARAQRLHETGDDTQAVTVAEQVVGAAPLGDQTLHAHARLRAEAWSLLGAIYEARGRTGQALEAYDHAAEADATDMTAVLGEGRMLLIDRPADALGRFEAVTGSANATSFVLPNGRTADFEARLGAARAKTQLDRVQEAHSTLTDLATEAPDDAEVQLWLGHVEEQLDHDDLAEQHYRESVRLAPAVFEPYLSLARLYDAAERTSDAVAVLESARSAVPQTAQVHEQLGTYALAQSRLPEAEREFQAALALDDALPAARFGLAVMLRRANRLDEAAAAFEQLAAVDPNHPGLALERGLLFEARHEEARAVEFYRQALAEHPDDIGLELRLGGALVSVGDYDAAETTLAPVMRDVQPHAEAEFYTGRIAFARGVFPEAQQHFNRAIALDATRGEFYMWAGWAALNANDIGLAISRAGEAIEHDATLGDAYYVRGAARVRSGAVRDALVDLQHALELSPTRYEAYAALADAHEQLRDKRAAIADWQRAVAAVDTNGEWWYELGRLQLDEEHTAESVHALGRATLLGEAATPHPFWLADAHRILADGMRLSNERAGAIEHYRRYLVLAPEGIDRDDVRHTLMDLGVVPDDP